MRKNHFKVLVSKDEDGFFTAECIGLPGCISDGKTRKEAVENVKEAIEAYLESMEKHSEKLKIKPSELVKVTV